jgi:hypothetical protein
VNAVIDTVKLETALLEREQVDCPLVHHFAPGVYLREACLPVGTFAIGHEHKTEHFNILLRGRVRVLAGGVVKEVSAPYIFVSGAGERKVVYVLEDAAWVNVHATDETDMDKLAMELIQPSAEYITAQQEKELLGL